MVTCAKCGKELVSIFDMIRIGGFGWVGKVAKIYPEYKNMWLCKGCINEIRDGVNSGIRKDLNNELCSSNLSQNQNKAGSDTMQETRDNGKARTDTCARCGRKLTFGERNLVYWNRELRQGYMSGDFAAGTRKDFPEYRGKKLCRSCVEQEEYADRKLHCHNPDGLCNNCGYFEEIRHERGGVDDLGTYFDESYSTYKCRKFSFDLNQSDYKKGRQCTSYISKHEYEEKCLKGEMEKSNAQIVLDFSSLKDALSQGGVVMTAYNCPKCNGMVDIPETGKVLVCKYCGTRIKAVDIFEKLKSLIQ